MAEILYTVRVTCPTVQVRGRFLACPVQTGLDEPAVGPAKAG